jgi:hypothetical protein
MANPIQYLSAIKSGKYDEYINDAHGEVLARAFFESHWSYASSDEIYFETRHEDKAK